MLAALAAAPQVMDAQQGRVRRGVMRTDTFWSQALGITKRLVVYLPPSYAESGARARRYPLAVYLHGGYGNETDWTVNGHLATTMDSLVANGMREMIVVMPDGDDGWWTTWHALNDVAACRRVRREENADSYCVPWPKYDDYVARDVIAHADSLYRTQRRRASRGIAGLSMGGYGAISIAARYPGTFAAAASHSGVLRPAMKVDSSTVTTTGAPTVRDARTRDELRAVSGARRWVIIEPAFGSDSVSWTSRDPSNLIQQALRRGDVLPSLFVDVGTEDHVLPMNRSFRDRMAQLKVPLVYAEWPGRHDWAYWHAHLPESLRFLAGRLAP
ncbi:MAG: esterase family protein [Gemmatimonadaceae bacterium]|nr:esterase family protein [Gemmatimonadaceae bacterium]